MAIVVVGGSAKDSGKTALICAIISTFPEFNWTAVKITAHRYGPEGTAGAGSVPMTTTIREETSAGSETDTARYLSAGARRALLVTTGGDGVPIEEIRCALGNDRNILFESNRIIDAVRPDIGLALVGSGATEIKASFVQLLRVADAVVGCSGAALQALHVREGIPHFVLRTPARLSTEMVGWLRERLHAPPQPDRN